MTDTITEHTDHSLHKDEPLVEMNDVGKAFGPIVALEGINLTVRAGEVACVLGDNGAGKSTLIKIISGLHPHTSGTLKVDGTPRWHRGMRRRNTAGPTGSMTRARSRLPCGSGHVNPCSVLSPDCGR
jgi:ABC-type branched-subunit amino acid transport system ATPase component